MCVKMKRLLLLLLFYLDDVLVADSGHSKCSGFPNLAKVTIIIIISFFLHLLKNRKIKLNLDKKKEVKVFKLILFMVIEIF